VAGGTKLLVVGFVLVAGLGVALLRLVASDTASAGGQKSSHEPAPNQAPAPAPTASKDTARSADKPAPIAAGGESKSAASAPAAPTIGALLPGNEEVVERDPDTGKQIFVVKLKELREANAVTTPLISDCIAASGFTGSGTAVLGMVVAKKKDKDGERVAVDTTSVEEDGTTITDAKLLECMNASAQAIKLPTTKSNINVWARRRIVIEDGKLQSNWIKEWGRIR
jgi:hypothetical protein